MTWKLFFTSSIGKKFIMAFTGLFLITFLIVHAGINSCIFLNDNGQTFNTFGHFMSHNWIVRFLEVGLFAGLILHIIQGLLLWKQNRAARPVGYIRTSLRPTANGIAVQWAYWAPCCYCSLSCTCRIFMWEPK